MAQLFLGEQAISSGNSGSNVTSLSELTNDMNFKSIIYLTNAEYTALISANTIDDEIIYIVTDIDGATGGSGGSGVDYIEITKNDYEALVSLGEIEEDKFYVITDLVTKEDLPDALAMSDVVSYMNENVETYKGQITTAKNNAINDIDEAVANMPQIIIMTQSDYESLSTKNQNAVYILK